MKSIKELAGELSGALTRDKRNDGAEFVHLKDGSPQWMTDVIRAVHGDKLPDDTVYAFVERCASAIAESNDEPSEAIYEIEPSVYTHDLTAWLHARADHLEYLDEVLSETLDCNGLEITASNLLMRAQASQIHEVGGSLLAELERFADAPTTPETPEAA